MKRHPDLLQLSRDHHGALKLARDARKASVSGDAGEITAIAQRVVQASPSNSIRISVSRNRAF